MSDDAVDWRPLLAALANDDARTAYARIVLGRDPRADAAADARPRAAARLARAVAALEDAGLVRAGRDGYEVDPTVFRRALDAAAEPPRTGIDRFVVDGRIAQYPANEPDRAELLAWVADRVLQRGETIGERQITQRLAAVGDDPVALRRYLVDAGYVERTPTGTEYARTSR